MAHGFSLPGSAGLIEPEVLQKPVTGKPLLSFASSRIQAKVQGGQVEGRVTHLVGLNELRALVVDWRQCAVKHWRSFLDPTCLMNSSLMHPSSVDM